MFNSGSVRPVVSASFYPSVVFQRKNNNNNNPWGKSLSSVMIFWLYMSNEPINQVFYLLEQNCLVAWSLNLWYYMCRAVLSHSVVSDPWTVAHQTHGLNPGLLHCRWTLYHLSHQGSPRILEWVAYPFSRGTSWPRNWTRLSFIVFLPGESQG